VLARDLAVLVRRDEQVDALEREAPVGINLETKRVARNVSAEQLQRVDCVVGGVVGSVGVGVGGGGGSGRRLPAEEDVAGAPETAMHARHELRAEFGGRLAERAAEGAVEALHWVGASTQRSHNSVMPRRSVPRLAVATVLAFARQ